MMNNIHRLVIILGLLVSGPGCSGVSDSHGQGVIKEVDVGTNEITIGDKHYVIATRAYIYGSDKGLIKQIFLRPGMKVKFKTMNSDNGEPLITELQLDKSSVELQGLR